MGSQGFGGSNEEELPEKLKCLLDQMNTFTSMCSYVQQGDISKSQLVKTNTRKCVLNKWHMVLGLNLVTNDTLNLPGTGCCGVVKTLSFGSLIETPKGVTMKGSLVIKKKKSLKA